MNENRRANDECLISRQARDFNEDQPRGPAAVVNGVRRTTYQNRHDLVEMCRKERWGTPDSPCNLFNWKNKPRRPLRRLTGLVIARSDSEGLTFLWRVLCPLLPLVRIRFSVRNRNLRIFNMDR